MSELFLRKEGGEYFIYLLGKNGEPRSNVNIKIKVMHRKFIKFGEVNEVLTTDKEGKVKLGHLKGCLGLNANVSLYNIDNNWMLYMNDEEITYP